jgi:hypothetical protein
LDEFFVQSTAYISYLIKKDNKMWSSSGTGFLVFIEKNTITHTGRMYLVTNKHVLPKSSESKTITVKVPFETEKDTTFIEFNVDIYNKDSTLNSFVKFHKNKNTDVAAIDITAIVLYKNLRISSIPSQLLLRKSDYKKHKIGLGDEVFIIGYPSSIYDKRSVMPIVRQGIISSNPYKEFYFNNAFMDKDSTLPNPLDGFLVDGSIFPGSSGSLVLLKAATEIDLEFTVSRESPFVLGIISKNFNNNKDQSIGLGLVFSSECIWEVLNEFK